MELMPLPHVLIGVVYSRNGIAAWGIEAARALLQAGVEVTILVTRIEFLPADLHAIAMETGKTEKRTVFKKMAGRLHWWSQFFLAPGFNKAPLQNAWEKLEKGNSKPGLILVIQTDFVWPNAPVPQWVVARSWPVSIKGYLAKMNQLKSQPWLNRLHDLVFWYKMDHKAYKVATGVLALTNRIASDLSALGLNAHRLYPCISMLQGQKEGNRKPGPPRLLTAALHLGDKRKNIGWMIQALGELHQQGIDFELTLVGGYDRDLESEFLQLVPQSNFTGSLPRADLFYQMQQHDVFVFASLQENWGYVLIEAISQGMCLFTPNIYPFDEINPSDERRFAINDPEDFRQKITKMFLVTTEDCSNFHTTNDDFIHNFSYKNFSERLGKILKS